MKYKYNTTEIETRLCSRVCVVAISSIALLGGSASAATLLNDDFANSDLASNPGTGGGFTYQDNGNFTSGSAGESGSNAQILDGSGDNTAGIRTTSTFDLSDAGMTYTTTWNISSWDAAPSGVRQRMFFALQTNDSWLFAGGAEESRILIEINAADDSSFLRYQNRSGSSNTNFETGTADLGVFAEDTNGFTAALTFDVDGYSFLTTGLDATNQVNLSGTWAALGTDFATITEDGDFHVSAYVQDSGVTGSAFDVDSITLTSVPEPSSAVLGGLGALLLLRRRR